MKSCYKIALFLFFSNVSINSYAQNTWQQKVDYVIDVRLDDSLHMLHGFEQFNYRNNSAESLSYIWVHLWPNAYKNEQSAFAKQQILNGQLKFQASKEAQRGNIDSLAFEVDGKAIEVQFNDAFPDICKLILPKPLASGESISISTPFRIKIPNSFSRFGHVAQAYQISQWYPKPAVFDSKGWHPISYLDQGEFYSEFGSFDVKISLPENYIIAATGNLLTDSENIFLAKLAIDTAINKIVYATPKSSVKYKTVHYFQDQIHDFAWFADKDFIVRQSDVQLPISKKTVKTYAFFKPKNAKKWVNATENINQTILKYSSWVGEYPYSVCTAIDGDLSAGGGMEYPTITVIGEVNSAKALETVIVHEVGHNWFYGILGSNEREHGWMDEGVNSFYEYRFIKESRNQKLMVQGEGNEILNNFFNLKYFPQGYENYLTFQLTASKQEDQPIETPSEQFTALNYGSVMYTKTALVLNYLQEYLGRDVFDSAMHFYYEKWKFKHPYPADFQAAFEEVSFKKLDWFFVGFFKYNDPIDFKILDVKENKKQLQVKIKNNSLLSAPLFVSALDKEGKILETYKMEPYFGTVLFFFDRPNVSRIKIDPLYVIPEVNRTNNSMRVNGIFKKTEKINLQFLGSIGNPDRTQVFFMPLLAYNHLDRLMPGLALYNHFYPFKKFEYEFAPFYSIAQNQWNGTGRMSYHYYPNYAKSITYALRFNSFSLDEHSYNQFTSDTLPFELKISERFRKWSLDINYEFKEASSQSKRSRNILYRYVNTAILSNSTYSDFFEDSKATLFTDYFILEYNQMDRRYRFPYTLNLNYEYSNNSERRYNKISATYITTIKYLNSKKGVNVRMFAGTILAEHSNVPRTGYFSISGNNDYLYDQSYINRVQGEQQQFIVNDGGFKSIVFIPLLRNMVSLNIKAPLNIPFPIGIFADVSYQPDISKSGGYFSSSDAGIYIPIVDNLVEVYFPIYNSIYQKDAQYLALKPSFGKQIRLMVNVTELQPLRLLRNLRI